MKIFPSDRTKAVRPGDLVSAFPGYNPRIDFAESVSSHSYAAMPRRKKQKETLFPEEPLLVPDTFIPDDFVNLNRVRFSHRYGKTQVTLKESFRVENLPYLKRIHRLDSVTFSHGGIVNGDVLSDLAPLKLRYLKIGRHNPCTDHDLEALTKLGELEVLNLHCSDNITDLGLMHLRKLKSLKRLLVHCNDNITDKSLVSFTSLPELETLQLFGSFMMTGKGWRDRGHSESLRELTIDGNWTNAGMVQFCRWVATLPQLEHVILPSRSNRDFSREDDDFFVSLEELFDEPPDRKFHGTVRWEAVRSRQRILRCMEMMRNRPISYHDIVEILGRDKYLNRAWNILLEQGVLKEGGSGGDPLYHLDTTNFCGQTFLPPFESNAENPFSQYDLAKKQIREAINIVDLVSSYVPLSLRGSTYMGPCPWHDDSQMSLQVNPQHQTFKCWICDIGGDVFSFIVKIEDVAFNEALKILADKAGIQLPEKRLC